MRFNFYLRVFRKLVQYESPFLLFSIRLLLRCCHRFLLNLLKMSIDLRLIEKQSHLTDDLFGCSLVLRTEMILSKHFQLFLKPAHPAFELFVLTLETFIFRTGDRNGLRGSFGGCCFVFHGNIVPRSAHKRHST